MGIYEKVEDLAIELYGEFNSEDWMEIAPIDVEKYWYGMSRAPKVYIRAKDFRIDLIWWDEDDNDFSLENVNPSDYNSLHEMLEAELFDDSWISQRIRVVLISELEKGEEG